MGEVEVRLALKTLRTTGEKTINHWNISTPEIEVD